MLRLILMPIFAGLIATAGITAVLWAINKSGWTNADMVRAIGGFFTKSYENALGIGLAIHFVNGIIIAAVYLHALSIMKLSNLGFEIFFGGLFGFGQGLIVGWCIVRFADVHPVEQFQQASLQVAVAHTFAHVVYGMLIGAAFGTMRLLGMDVSPGI